MPENLIKYSVIIPPFLQPWAMKMAWKDAGRVLRSVDAITTPTRRAADLLEAAGGLTGVLPISCGIDASRFANETPTSNENPRVLFLGRLDFEKHIHNLLKAVAKLPPHLNTQVDIVGDGGERKHLVQLAETLGISANVHFLGHITEEELPKVYERSTVFAMPSIAELQSIATMEAMASGRPVVAADAMALPHLVHDGDNGYLFPPDDVDAFADRLLRVLTADADELERLSENSLHLIQSHDINRTLTIFEGLYRGDQDADKTSDDNLSSYLEPIGRLSAAMHKRVLRVRHRAYELRQEILALRERAEDLGDDAREKLEDLRDDVVRAAKRSRAKVRRQIRQATDIIRGDDE
jgi:glycosyltransferase involved in cell wall biosynthesis